MNFNRLCKICQSVNIRTFSLNRSFLSNEVGLYNQIKPHISINIYKNVYYSQRAKQISGFKLQTFICKRTFHSSNPNKALPPLVWVVLRSVFRIAAVFTGRSIRKWWASLPPNRRNYILSKIKSNLQNIMVVGALCCGAVYLYYILHLVEDPITKRNKFLIFTEKQIIQMAMLSYEILMEEFKGKIIKSGYQYNNVLHITTRILNANKHLPGINREWQVFIVNDIDKKNAFVLPSGHIFIFTGMLAVVSNEDQLAIVIAHEMAHAILFHSAEQESRTHLLEMLLILPLVALWSFFPDSVALFSHYVTEFVSDILFKLPFSRSIESEADVVGLGMISRACYDPKQASLFWRKMEHLEQNGPEIIWLSTHPSNQSRYNTFDDLMPSALKIVADHCRSQEMVPHLSRSLPHLGALLVG